MRRRVGTGIAIAALLAAVRCGGGGTPPPPAPRPPAVAALIAKLRARDARIRSAYLPYRLEERGTGPVVVKHTGWWALDASRTASFVSRSAERYVWNGGGQVTVSAAGEARFDDRGDSVVPSDRVLAAEWGLGWGWSNWATVLATSSRVDMVGRETVAGRDCLVLVCDIPGDPSIAGATWANPVRVWFDDGSSGLAMRYEALVPSGSLARAGVGPAQEAPFAVNLGDAGRVVFTRYEVKAIRDLGEGLTLPSVTVYDLPTFPAATTSTTRLGDGAWINRPADPAWFAVPPRPLTRRQRAWLQAGLALAALAAVLLSWTWWYRRRRRRDPEWPGADDPDAQRALVAVRRLAWLAPPVAVGDLAQKLAIGVPLVSGRFTDVAGESLLGRAALAATIVTGTGLLLVAALRLDRALRGAPTQAPAAVVLAALAGIVGGLPWVGLIGASAATIVLSPAAASLKWDDWVLVTSAVLLQLPIVLVGLLAAAWWPRVARGTGRSG